MRKNDSKFTNDEIYSRDWAASDRQRFLRSCRLRAPRMTRAQSTDATMSAVCGTDVSGRDPRSVKAYLRGDGDLRAGWWAVFSAAYRTMMPGRGIEHAMHAFHTFHHSLTLAKWEFINSRRIVQRAFQDGGLLAALKSYR